LYSSNASSSASTSTSGSSTSSSTTSTTSSSAGGPRALYDEGVQSGAYRPDPLQAATVGKLQALYDELRLVYPAPRRPSGLTIVDSVAVKQDKRSWCARVILFGFGGGGGW
jgi:predicted ATPase